MLTNNIELVGENVASALTLVGKKEVYLFGYLGWCGRKPVWLLTVRKLEGLEFQFPNWKHEACGFFLQNSMEV